MNVLLILSSPSTFPAHGEFQPMGLCYLASFLRQKGHKVTLVHQLYPQSPSDDEILRLADEHDAIGFSTYTTNIRRSLETAGRLKERTNGAKPVIFGGPFITGWPDLVSRPEPDYVVIGEGETAMAELLECLETGRTARDVDGIAYFDGEVVVTKPRGRIRDLDALPIPGIDELPHHRYTIPAFSTILEMDVANLFAIFTSRGCPHSCVFCISDVTWKSQWFARSVPNVMEELDLRFRQGRRAGGFLDPDINIDRNRAIELYEAIVSSGYGIRWFGETSPSSIDGEILGLMKRSGCIGLFFGVETGSPEMQKDIRKKLDLERFRETAKTMARLDLLCVCSFIVGLPWESRETIAETKRYLRTLSMDLVSFAFAEPYPGTILWDIALKEGWIKKSLSLFDRPLTEPVLPTYHLDIRDLKFLQWKLAFAYYTSPRFFAHIVSRFARSPRMMFRLFAALFLTAMKAFTQTRKTRP